MLRPSGELCVHGCNSGTQRNCPIIVEKRRVANFVLSTTYLTVVPSFRGISYKSACCLFVLYIST